MKLIGRLFRVERLADLRRLDPDGRMKLRQQWSEPALQSLYSWIVATIANEPPSSELARATKYLKNHWSALQRFLQDGRLPIHNNQVEQQLRDVALGRKNFLVAGSHQATERAAILYSLLRTCAVRGVPPAKYLADVLRRLADGWPADRMDELTPDRWLALYGQDQAELAVAE